MLLDIFVFMSSKTIMNSNGHCYIRDGTHSYIF